MLANYHIYTTMRIYDTCNRFTSLHVMPLSMLRVPFVGALSIDKGMAAKWLLSIQTCCAIGHTSFECCSGRMSEIAKSVRVRTAYIAIGGGQVQDGIRP